MTGSRPPVSLRSDPFNRRGGFTLIELLVVMGIIIIIAAVSVPAFRFITGSRSVDSGQNVVNAMMGRARSEAIVSGDNVGVFFFVDPRNDRSTLALVRQAANDSENSGWSMNANGNASGGGVIYYDASNPDIDPSSALQLVKTTDQKDRFVTNLATPFQRLAAIPFRCTKSHSPNGGNEVQSVKPYLNGFWDVNSGALEIVRDTEFQLLPQGVGAAVVVDPLAQPVWTNNFAGVGVDRYVRTGCVMFDGQGRFASLPYDVYATSHLGQALLLNNIPGATAGSTITLANGAGTASAATPPPPLFSGFGAVLFDRQALLADAKTNAYAEGDYFFSITGHLPQPPYGLAPSTDKTAEALKQQWLDTNGLLLTATRYNGAMTKGE